jgi:polyisoprenoid-binding protein YceI
MKTFKFLTFLFMISNPIMAQNFIPNTEKSKINFIIKNIGINVNGSFSGLKGEIIFDAKNLNQSFINVSVNSNSINTENSTRDKHLRQTEYFDVDKFQEINFKSTKIESSKRLNRYNVEGNLTIKGISKLIQFELIATEKDSNLDLKCNFEINRRTYKVGGSSLVLSDNVKMYINIMANK